MNGLRHATTVDESLRLAYLHDPIPSQTERGQYLQLGEWHSKAGRLHAVHCHCMLAKGTISNEKKRMEKKEKQAMHRT